ncbi:DUF397 domain-containing protein [Amycolatopsis nigrescens]|uniref:DUF397 domain-containing protein n=1 Tax=Amycolatopsis nigrescens TaxID=381445 RepID=UPI000475FC0C|nr:DUF397 domain-containing protein [Amycolatopsis nigrescens]
MDSDVYRAAALTAASSWRKSSYSNYANCLELNDSVPGHVGVRDSKLGEDGPVLVFSVDEMRAFLLRLKGGESAHLRA